MIEVGKTVDQVALIKRLVIGMAYTGHVVEITETVNMSEVILQSMFSRILTFSGWPGWLNAGGYKHAMLHLDANIKDACYSSKATLP